MSTQNELKNADQALQPAIDCLKALKRTHTLQEITEKFNKPPFSLGLEKSTVGRWIRYVIPGPMPRRPRIEANIVQAVGQLPQSEKSLVPLTFVAVKHTTEAIPLLILDKFPEWQESLGINATVLEKDKIRDVIDALGNEADIAIAPKQSDTLNNPTIVPFCDVAQIEVVGLFPFPFKESKENFANNLANLKKKRKKIGVLPNAAYEKAMPQFMAAHAIGKKEPPDRVTVHHHAEALGLLSSGAIVGLIGNPVFISNTLGAINSVRKQGKTTVHKLHYIGFNVFEKMVMQVFVKDDDNRMIHRKALELIYKSINALHNKESREPDTDEGVKQLIGAIDSVLRLDSRKGVSYNMSGKQIIGNFSQRSFRIENFDISILMNLIQS